MRDFKCQLKVLVDGSSSDIDTQLSIQAGGEFLFQSQELAAPVTLLSNQLVVVPNSVKGNKGNCEPVCFRAVPQDYERAFTTFWGKSSVEGAVSLTAGDQLINATVELIPLPSKKDVNPKECEKYEEAKAEINKLIVLSPGFKK